MLCDLTIEGNVKLQSATKLVETKQSKKYSFGNPFPLPPNQCCAAVVKGRRQQKVTQHCPGGEGEGEMDS